ncbi:rod shape-determining protein MreD [Nonomuraea polychroma]|uniref:Rod shape-determining protein MreD n=1 Tax=Nonomuraea polychroma TaxID=46176 RepID=A0A438M9R6_9ACTN|nr:rod shape-determining protein MreD [Nonomuraea polychroma]RVX42459.1 rod shape-determining protein MreD [Nonomuraea polychroma]
MLVLFLLVAPLLQVLLVNRSPWGGPDLVALAVVWLALSRGPVWGCVAGLAGGLAADVTPPADGTVGRTALVLAVTGLLAGRWREGKPSPEGRTREHNPLLVGAAGAALATLLQAGAAVALGDEPWRAALAALPWTLGWTVALGALVSAVLLRRRRSREGEPRVAMRRA